MIPPLTIQPDSPRAAQMARERCVVCTSAIAVAAPICRHFACPHKERTTPMPTSDAELLPCPFCGGPAEPEHLEDGRWSAGCNDRHGEGDCMGYQSLQTFSRKCEAIAAWNTRAAPTPSAMPEAAGEELNLGEIEEGAELLGKLALPLDTGLHLISLAKLGKAALTQPARPVQGEVAVNALREIADHPTCMAPVLIAMAALDKLGVQHRGSAQQPGASEPVERVSERIENAGYVRAFYELAAMMDIEAQPRSPRDVWENQMKPQLERALRQARPTGEVAIREKALREAATECETVADAAVGKGETRGRARGGPIGKNPNAHRSGELQVGALRCRDAILALLDQPQQENR